MEGLEIILILTAVNARGKGYAKTLISAAINENPGKLFTLRVDRDNASAIALYQKLGFRFERPSELKTGKRILYMSRTPDPPKTTEPAPAPEVTTRRPASSLKFV